MKKPLITIILALILFSFTEVNATNTEINLPIKHRLLDNGLNVYMIDIKYIPAVTVALFFNVGSKDERPYENGVSHFLEHMMFKTTKNLKAGEYSKLIKNNGGYSNAATSFDYTTYYNVLPKKALELGLRLEAERMRNLTIDKREFISEKNVVLEELGNRYENDPAGYLFTKFIQFVYDKSSYGRPIIGTRKSLKDLTPEIMRQYYKRFYSPNNAHLVVVGDIKIDKTFSLIKKYFAGFKKQTINRPKFIEEPTQTKEKRIVLKKQVQLPQGLIYYHGPNAMHPDSSALEMIEFILFNGRSARLVRKLVLQMGLAVNVAGGQYLRVHNAPFSIYFIARKKEHLPLIEKVIYREIEKFKQGKIRIYDLQKAKNKFISQYIMSLQKIRSIANTIGHGAVLGDYNFFIKTRIRRIMSLKPEDLIKVANKYFKKSNRNVGYLLPK